MEAKTKVLVGQVSGLPCYRRYDYFIANRKDRYIKVHYDEWLEASDGRILNLAGKSYVVKNLKSGEIINNLDLPLVIIDENNPLTPIPNPSLVPLASDFNGFDNWFNYIPNGQSIGNTIEGAIDQTLLGLPIGCKDGWIITQPN